MDGELDFSKYTNRKLREAQVTIDRSRYPLNAARLESELKARELAGGIDVVRPTIQPPTVAELPRLVGPGSEAKLVHFDSLSRRDQFKVYWGFMWRSYVVWLASLVAAIVVAVVVHILIGLFAPSIGPMSPNYQRTGQIIGFVIGLPIGLYFTWHFLRWILNAEFGRFRLLLGRVGNDDAA